MKRAVWLLALTVGVGLLALGDWDPTQPIPVNPPGENPLTRLSSFTIPGKFVIWAEGSLAFSGQELTNVTDPGFVGWAKTDTLVVYGLTNQNIRVTGVAWAYKLNNLLCPKLLRTRLTGYAYYWDGDSWEPPSPPLPPGGTYGIYPDYPGGYRSATADLPGCAAGYYKGEMYLEVYRNGYMDPAGTYEAKVTITVTGLP